MSSLCAPPRDGAALPSVGSWVDGLTRSETRAPALHADGETLTHAALDALVTRAAALLPDVSNGRRLVHLPVRRDVGSVVAHLAVQRAGHVGLLHEPGPASVTAAWPADLVATGDRDTPFTPAPGSRPHRPRHLLHPDLALLLSTSGSTGSAKLVRLSHANLASNARAIADSLGLRSTDRGALPLPLHYCYGLSVLHSHLSTGGSLALSEAPVTESRFWDESGPVTTLAAVPHTLELLEATGRLTDLPPTLRLVTQAGGAMGEHLAARVREVAARQGWELAVMYGQTEATARMTVRRAGPELLPHEAVGWPVPGSSMRVDRTVPEAKGEVGELVFTGPGVMLGYAEEPADLAMGRTTHELRTGDLGRLSADGLVHVTGRRALFAKIMGLRLDLAEVESRLQAEGLDCCVTSDDERLLVSSTGADVEWVASAAARASSLPRHLVVVDVMDRLPRTSSGKLDRTACRESARRLVAETSSPSRDVQEQVLAALTSALGRPADPERSFTDQGGDSFSLVRASIALERLLGPLPRGWHHVPVRRLVERGSPHGAARGRRAPFWRSLETSVVVRALAVLAICGTHVGLVDLPGGAHALLVIAGYHLALLTLSAPDPRTRLRRSLAGMAGVALPASAVALVVTLTTGAYGWANVVHLNWLLGRVEWGPRIELWFVEALLAATVVLTGLMALPRVARAVRRHPWEWALALTLVALVPRYLLVPEGTGPTRGLPGTVFWLVAGGAALAVATTRTRTLLTLGVLALGLVDFFIEPGRGLSVLAAVTAVALVPRLRVPALLVPAVGTLAAASLHIYLVQFQVFTRVESAWVGLLASIGLGIALARASQPVTSALTRWIADPPPPRTRLARRQGLVQVTSSEGM